MIEKLQPIILQFKVCSFCQTELQISNFPKKGKGRIESQCKKCFNMKRQRNRDHRNKWNILNLPTTIYFSEIRSNWIDCLLNILCDYKFLLSAEPEVTLDSVLNRCSQIKLLLD